MPADRRHQRLGEAVPGLVGAHVDEMDGGLARGAGPLGQHQPLVAAAAGVFHGLERRRGGAEHQRHAELPGAPHRQVPGRVAEAVLLLVAGVVLLVDDDQPRPWQRREDGRAGADDDLGGAVPRGGPGAQPLALGEPGVQHRHRHREPAAEAVQQLRRQADLRHQHQALLAGIQAFPDAAQVDLGLAAAGDAVEQEAAEAGGGRDGGHGLGLARGQRRGIVCCGRNGFQDRSEPAPGDPAPRDERIDRPPPGRAPGSPAARPGAAPCASRRSWKARHWAGARFSSAASAARPGGRERRRPFRPPPCRVPPAGPAVSRWRTLRRAGAGNRRRPS